MNTSAAEPELAREIADLEHALWETDKRFDPDLMDGLFAPDFWEIGRSGRIYQRAELIFPVDTKHPINARPPLENLQVRRLDTATVQVTYVSETVSGGPIERANRSSIWSWTGDRWQLRFHQGTPC